jgi:predicted RNA-binding Zn ribbon-like protein
MGYAGPLRDEPLAIELHNTIYASKRGRVDALADPASARAWLEALAPRLHAAAETPGAGAPPSATAAGAGRDSGQARPSSRIANGWLPPGAWPRVAQLVGLRDVVRPALRAAAAGGRPPRAAIEAINAASRRAPRSMVALWQPGGRPARGTDFAAASRADVVLAAFAASAIDLLTGPQRDDLRSCGAPQCVLMFLKDHPRREWCSDGCGNRARQARHYERYNRSQT